jgi:hypothetical protein
MEDDVIVELVLLLELVAGFMDEMGNIDDGKRIGAGHDQQLTDGEHAQSLARAQRGQRTFKAAQVEYDRFDGFDPSHAS